MSYDIQITIPEDSFGGHLIASLTSEQHITPNQTVEKIIDFAAQKQIAAGKIRIPGLPSEPMSAEDAAEVDEAMAIVMEARRERSARPSRA
jgi:hypothetical protein